MALELKLPAVSAEMEYGTIVRWLKAEGDSVVAGEVVVEVESREGHERARGARDAGVLSGSSRSRATRSGSARRSRSSPRTADGVGLRGRRRATTLEQLLLRMWRIRAFELRAMELFEEKLIRGSVHPYIGMEAIAVGVCAALRPDDFITSTHRGHGHCVAKGLDLAG